jgi:hypothetical protein
MNQTKRLVSRGGPKHNLPRGILDDDGMEKKIAGEKKKNA